MSALLDEEVLQALLPGQLNRIKKLTIEIKSYSLFIKLASRVVSRIWWDFTSLFDLYEDIL